MKKRFGQLVVGVLTFPAMVEVLRSEENGIGS